MAMERQLVRFAWMELVIGLCLGENLLWLIGEHVLTVQLLQVDHVRTASCPEQHQVPLVTWVLEVRERDRLWKTLSAHLCPVWRPAPTSRTRLLRLLWDAFSFSTSSCACCP